MKWLLIFFIFGSLLYSAPAFSGTQKFKQPDGTTFNAKQRGDEYLHWIETENDDILLYNKKSRQFEYAAINSNEELIPSGEAIRTSSDGKRSAKLTPEIRKDALHRLWREKRRRETIRRNSLKKKP